MNLQQELAELRARIDELEAQAKTEADDSWPKYGNECWAIDGDGDLFDFVWNLEDNQLHRLEIGNVFRTEEEAKREVECRKVLTELRRLAKASWGGIKIDCHHSLLSNKCLMYSPQRRSRSLGMMYRPKRAIPLVVCAATGILRPRHSHTAAAHAFFSCG